NNFNLEGVFDFNFRDALRVEIRQLSKDVSPAQKVVVEEKRQKLAARITKFHEVADAMMEGIEVNAGTEHTDDIRFCGPDVEEHGWEGAHLEEVLDEEAPAEAMCIWMP
ncbi:uncharacterized protein F5891DRAFT_922004, partial [Suillus fuscotomentosus]